MTGATMGPWAGSLARCQAFVALPANDEAERIGLCLAALATQRDQFGAPLAAGTVAILVYANNCTDRTAAIARDFAVACPHPIIVVEETLPPDQANAGWARKRAMDLVAQSLVEAGRHDGIILTTDADSAVSSTWISATFDEFDRGVDCVAGYIDASPIEIMNLGAAFLRRSRLEDDYLRLVAEINARCDPRLHNPWPNHRVSSGASLAVTLAAYLTVGGLPPRALGEDVAFTLALECAGLKVRHSLSVAVTTSCRFDGRATGGAADTMRLRHAIEDAPCDDDLEPALYLMRRALCRGAMRRDHARQTLGEGAWPRRLGLTRAAWLSLVHDTSPMPFEHLWSRVETSSPRLRRSRALRPADLPRQIDRARQILGWLRNPALRAPRADRADMSPVAEGYVSVAA